MKDEVPGELCFRHELAAGADARDATAASPPCLADDLWIEIFRRLPQSALATSVGIVSRHWRRLAQTKYLWTHVHVSAGVHVRQLARFLAHASEAGGGVPLASTVRLNSVLKYSGKGDVEELAGACRGIVQLEVGQLGSGAEADTVLEPFLVACPLLRRLVLEPCAGMPQALWKRVTRLGLVSLKLLAADAGRPTARGHVEFADVAALTAGGLGRLAALRELHLDLVRADQFSWRDTFALIAAAAPGLEMLSMAAPWHVRYVVSREGTLADLDDDEPDAVHVDASAIVGLSALRHLTLGAGLTIANADAALAALAAQGTLAHLTLQGLAGVLALTLKDAAALRVVRLQHLPHETRAVRVERCPQLEELEVSGDGDLDIEVVECARLKQLSLNNVPSRLDCHIDRCPLLVNVAVSNISMRCLAPLWRSASMQISRVDSWNVGMLGNLYRGCTCLHHVARLVLAHANALHDMLLLRGLDLDALELYCCPHSWRRSAAHTHTLPQGVLVACPKLSAAEAVRTWCVLTGALGLPSRLTAPPNVSLWHCRTLSPSRPALEVVKQRVPAAA